MHVSTILDTSIKSLGYADKIYTKSSSNDKRNVEKTPKSEIVMQNSKQELFKNINEWKTFCHQQISKNNLDYIV